MKKKYYRLACVALFSYLYIMKTKDMQALIEENKKLAAQVEKLIAEKVELENTVSSLKSMMDWFRKKLFGKMSEKNLPLDPSVLEPTLFDMSLSEEDRAALEAEVKKMEEQNAKVIEVKSHKREVRKPVIVFGFYRLQPPTRKRRPILIW